MVRPSQLMNKYWYIVIDYYSDFSRFYLVSFFLFQDPIHGSAYSGRVFLGFS